MNAPIHRWGSLHKFQIFKQNLNILIISNFIEFFLILGFRGVGVGECCGYMGCRDDVRTF